VLTINGTEFSGAFAKVNGIEIARGDKKKNQKGHAINRLTRNSRGRQLGFDACEKRGPRGCCSEEVRKCKIRSRIQWT